MESLGQQQKLHKTDPALQGLILPSPLQYELPAYSNEPTLLDPSHCRLCLQPVPPNGMEAHLQTACEAVPEGCTETQYRRLILRQTLSAWPQSIPAQVLRTRLAAFKHELRDTNFAEKPCACCCRLKRQCKLQRACFPSPSHDTAPTWLPWNDDEWRRHRAEWFDQMDAVLNIEQYLATFFQTSERLALAQRELLAFEEGSTIPSAFADPTAADSWIRRVAAWITNLRRDLTSDSLPSPADPLRRWMLFPSADVTVSQNPSELTCSLCKDCLYSFSQVQGKDRRPSVRMPEMARANGMWRGPDAPELSTLTYCEAKVINLARLYVSVKRVFLDRRSYAGTSLAEAPLFHQKNVVAYPQNPDAALTALGMTPASLARVLQVQFVGENRADLQQAPDLRVSVAKLRSAFRWLSANSWPFMEATKQHLLWETEALDKPLEDLLRAYAVSVGSNASGVPSEIIQGASKIPETSASVTASGPANCTPAAEEELESGHPASQDEQEVTANCAGILDGGIDDLTPIQMWDEVMKRYKLAQICGQEIERLKNSDKKSEKERLQLEQAQAVASMLAEAEEGGDAAKVAVLKSAKEALCSRATRVRKKQKNKAGGASSGSHTAAPPAAAIPSGGGLACS